MKQLDQQTYNVHLNVLKMPTEEQFKIYQLIYSRALASLMTAAKEEVTTVTFNGGK